MTEVIPDQTLDVRGTISPMPVVRAAKAMKTLHAGAVLEVLASDSAIGTDVREWSTAAGHELISVAEEKGTWRVLLRKS
ncbi:MAG: hypothetical protein QOG62_2029 [Thermoleophilaceae bacterium]|jgi:tRNA 2-thiouridine synthesizing protein A|nr:hypothetical protein [Thermoleophilaceae bacterium]